MHAIFQKKGKKGQKNVRKVKKRQNILKFGQKCNEKNFNEFWKRTGKTACDYYTQLTAKIGPGISNKFVEISNITTFLHMTMLR